MIGPFLVLMLILVVVISILPLPTPPYTERTNEPILETHDLIMLTLLAAIALRSLVWNTLQFLFDEQVALLLALGAAAAGGKLLGSILADRVGWRRWTMGALLVAAPLLTFGRWRSVNRLRSECPPARQSNFGTARSRPP